MLGRDPIATVAPVGLIGESAVPPRWRERTSRAGRRSARHWPMGFRASGPSRAAVCVLVLSAPCGGPSCSLRGRRRRAGARTGRSTIRKGFHETTVDPDRLLPRRRHCDGEPERHVASGIALPAQLEVVERGTPGVIPSARMACSIFEARLPRLPAVAAPEGEVESPAGASWRCAERGEAGPLSDEQRAAAALNGQAALARR